MPRTTPTILLVLSATLLAAACAAGPVRGQIPERFTNLQVLPEDIAREELVATMRGFTFATGLRCSSCHVGEEGQPLGSYDFASDEKANKRKAREMIRMVRDINERYLAALPDPAGVRVECATCHGGVRRPETIEAVLRRVTDDDGVDAAIERYRALRAEYYGAGAYDFRERPVVNVAGELARAGDLDGASRLLEMMVELEPDAWASWFTLGQLHERRGDAEAAIAAYERSLALRPDNEAARERIRALRG